MTATAAGEHRRPDALRHGPRRARADDVERHVDRHADDHLHLPVAALQRRGQLVRGHRRRDLGELHGGLGRRRQHAALDASPGPTRRATPARSRPSARVVAAAPPVNTVLPVISGTARDTQTLSATTGTWTGTPTITYTYQWQRCDASGAACQPIVGATASTYVLTSADVGGTTRVVVTGHERRRQLLGDVGRVRRSSSATLPVNTVLPAISGPLTEGSTVDRLDRHVDGHADDHLHLPVAALQRGRQQLRRPSPARPPRPTRSSPPTSATPCASSSPRRTARGSASATSAAADGQPGRAGEHRASDDHRHRA